MGKLETASKIVHHWWKARPYSAFHSPYLFQLFIYCFNESNHFPLFGPIEQERQRLIQSEDRIVRQDFGAGSSTMKNTVDQRVGDIATQALSLPWQCRFMSRLAAFTGTKAILELGTSLGISTAYLSAGAPEASIKTIEGDPAVAAQAQMVFEHLALTNIRQEVNTFEKYLIQAQQQSEFYDLVFLDGNHRSEALLSYFDKLLPCFRDSTIVIVDDIYWSDDMTHGWEKLRHRPEVTQSVDLYHFGLLFLNPDFMDKVHHKVRPPWRSWLVR